MGSLLHPVGPEEPRVYWVRRSLVAVVALALVAGVAWLVWPKEPVVSAVPPPTTTSSVTASGSSTPATSITPTPSPTATGPVACDPTLMKLDVAGFQKVKVGAENTAFTLTVTNNTKVACILTISSETYTLTVTSGKDRIWSTADCAKWIPEAELTLDGGATHEFSVTWTLRRSSAKCKLTKDELKPGTYVATASLSDQASAKQAMQLIS